MRSIDSGIASMDPREPLVIAAERARAAWPAVSVPAEGFAEHLRGLGRPIESLALEDLYLAWACVQRDAVALLTLEGEVAASAGALLERLAPRDAVSGSGATVLCRALLAGSPPLRLSDYAGQLPLRPWLRAAAIRMALGLHPAAEVSSAMPPGAQCPSSEALASYGRGDAGDGAGAEIEAHLPGCPGCRRALAEALGGAWKPRLSGAGAAGVSPPDSGEAGFAPGALKTGTTVGPYVLLEQIGSGGMGVVFSAYDPRLDRKVALKLLWRGPQRDDRSSGQARLLREAQALARLSHPNVVAVHDVGTFHGQVFMAMEFIEGDTLTGWLAGGKRRWREVLDVFLQAGRGLVASHEAGLIHRDFKPDNVLVGRSGRVCVTDFGLVRPTGEASSPTERSLAPAPDDDSPISGPVLDMQITRADVVVGTPAYMAPEQLKGQAADARSDQFSFCVSLFRALYGARPFEGNDGAETYEAIRARRIAPEPRGMDVPRWIRRVLVRGLSPEPGERFPSMRALLDELSRDPSAKWRRGLAIAGVLLLVGASALVLRREQDQRAQQCTGGTARLAGVWDPQRKEAIHEAFMRTGRAWAPDAWAGVERRLDARAGAWVAMHRDACEATRLRGTQSEKVLELRMLCLDRRLAELKSLSDLLATADAQVVEKAVEAASALPSLDGCADAAALAADVPRPTEPEARAALDAATLALTEAKTLLEAGRYPAALKRAEAAVESARRARYRPVEAEALEVRGRILLYQRDTKAAEAGLREAVRAGIAGKAPAVVAAAWNDLIIAAREQVRFEEAHRWADDAAAAIEAAGGSLELEADRLSNLGVVASSEADYESAVRYQQRALALRTQVYGREHPKVATALISLSGALGNVGRSDEALLQDAEALAIDEKMLGPEHPSTTRARAAYAGALAEAGRSEEALVQYRRALALLERDLGKDHPHVAMFVLMHMAQPLVDAGKPDEAVAALRRAIPILEKTYGKGHPAVAYTILDLGYALRALGDHAGQLAATRQAQEMLERALEPRNPRIAHLAAAVAEALRFNRDFIGAKAQDDRALALFNAAQNRPGGELAEVYLGLGEDELGLGHPGAAIEHLERALPLFPEHGMPGEREEAKFALARALWEAGRDRPRAVALAKEARAGYARFGAGHASARTEVDAWLASHLALPSER